MFSCNQLQERHSRIVHRLQRTPELLNKIHHLYWAVLICCCLYCFQKINKSLFKKRRQREAWLWNTKWWYVDLQDSSLACLCVCPLLTLSNYWRPQSHRPRVSEPSGTSGCYGKWHICWPVTKRLLEVSVCCHIASVTKKLLHEKPQTATFTFTPFTVSLHKQNKIEILEAFHRTFNGTLWKKVANMRDIRIFFTNT